MDRLLVYLFPRRAENAILELLKKKRPVREKMCRESVKKKGCICINEHMMDAIGKRVEKRRHVGGKHGLMA